MTILNFPENTNKGSESMTIDRLVLPVAPLGNKRIRFAANKKSVPAITPGEAIAWIGDLIKGGKEIKGVEIKGPGDALAIPQVLLKTLELLKNSYPEIEVGLTTLGLGAAKMAEDLAEYNIGQVTIEVEAIDPEIIQKIYAWVRPGRKTIPLAKAAPILAENQQEAVAAFVQAGFKVRIQTTVYPGINDLHVETIAQTMAKLGAASMAILPFRRDEESEENALESCDTALLSAARKQAAVHLKVDDKATASVIPPPTIDIMETGALLPKPTKERPNVAVASSNGMDVDLHLGQAERMLIYGPRDDGLACLLEARKTPESESGSLRWQKLAQECLHDCFALLAANAGENPKKILADLGIKVIIKEDDIEGLVDLLYGGGKKKKCKK